MFSIQPKQPRGSDDCVFGSCAYLGRAMLPRLDRLTAPPWLFLNCTGASFSGHASCRGAARDASGLRPTGLVSRPVLLAPVHLSNPVPPIRRVAGWSKGRTVPRLTGADPNAPSGGGKNFAIGPKTVSPWRLISRPLGSMLCSYHEHIFADEKGPCTTSLESRYCHVTSA